MRALFGTAGNPEAFYAAGKKQSKDMPAWLREKGLDAYEYQCGKGVTVGEATARAIGRGGGHCPLPPRPLFCQPCQPRPGQPGKDGGLCPVRLPGSPVDGG